MEWSLYQINETSGRNVPFVSIGRGQLDFNAAACNLVNDNGQYNYVQIFTGKEKGKTVVAVKFIKTPENNSIMIKRKTQNGKVIQGMTIVNKGVVSSLFGKDGINEGMIRHKVELIEEDMLKIVD